MTDGAAPATLLRPVDVFATTAVTLTDGGQGTATGAFTMPPLTRTQGLRIELGPWLARRLPSETTSTVRCTGYAEPGAPFGLAIGPGLWTIEAAAPTTADATVGIASFTYANPLPATWPGLVRCELQHLRGVRMADGSTRPFAIRSMVDAPTAALVQLRPSLAPPRDATLAGVLLDTGGEVIVAPTAPVTLTWTAVAEATEYQVLIRRVTTTPQGAAAATRVATIATTGTALALPAALFEADARYVVSLDAVRATGGLAAGQLRRRGALGERAATLSQAITIRR